MTVRHVVLVGLPGAGKSTVGPLLAARLGWPFVDIDEQIEADAGCSVAEIFAHRGEAEFRRLERHAVERAIDGPRAVIAPGGGWAVQADALNDAALRADTIYMQCEPETAAARLGSAAGRPLLAGGDHEARIRALHAARHSIYVCASATVDANSPDPAEVASAIERALRAEYK